MIIEDYNEQLPMFVRKLEHYPFVIRIPWLQLDDIAVYFALNTVTFEWQYCTAHCHATPVTVQGVMEDPPDLGYPVKGFVIELQIQPQRLFRGNIVILNGASFFCTVKNGRLTVLNASLYDINMAIEAKDHKERLPDEIVPE